MGSGTLENSAICSGVGRRRGKIVPSAGLFPRAHLLRCDST
jgi:hypothetical protein